MYFFDKKELKEEAIFQEELKKINASSKISTILNEKPWNFKHMEFNPSQLKKK